MKNVEQKTFKWALIDTDNLNPNEILLATLPLPRKSSLTFGGVLEGRWSLSNLLSYVTLCYYCLYIHYSIVTILWLGLEVMLCWKMTCLVEVCTLRAVMLT